MSGEVAKHSADQIFVESFWPTSQELNLRRKTESLLDDYDYNSHQLDDRNEVTFDAISVLTNKIESLKEEEEDRSTQGGPSSDTPLITLI